jgi:hypothetical protein
MSDTQPQQSFANHARMVPGFHYVTGLLAISFFGWGVYRAITEKSIESHHTMLGGAALLGVYWYARSFPLKAQDRVIRLEEQLRLTRLLPDDLRARIGDLSAKQLIALRFASDAEIPELVRWVLTSNIQDSKTIKQKITTWRPDHHRV